MEKLKSLIPKTTSKMISESTTEDLPSTCYSLLDFFLSLPLFHQVVEQLTDPQKSLCSKNTETASNYKQKGNNCFTSGDYDQALKFYTQALRFAPMDYVNEAEKDLVSTVYVNRASTLHKMGFLVECVRDCDRAIVLSPSYVKAWYRRGKANVSLEKFEDAMNDLNVAMSLEHSPSGKSRIKNEVDILSSQCQKVSNPTRKSDEKSFGSPVDPRLIELQCVTTPDKGRGMTSENDIPQASLIHREEPYAVILLKHNRDTHCHFCLNDLPKDSVPCSSCSIPLYCSDSCQVQAGAKKSTTNLNSNLLDENVSNNGEKLVSSISLASNQEVAAADSNGLILEHRHECGGANWAAVLPSEIILAGRVLAKSIKQTKHYRGSLKAINVLELTHHYAQMPVESKLELHILSVVLTYCLHHSCAVDFPLKGNSVSQLVVLLSQIRVNSMAVIHMQSQCSYGALEQTAKVLPFKDCMTSDIIQAKVGQAIYSTASLFNHSCQPNIHAYFLSRTLFVRSTEYIPAGSPLELSYGPQVGQWGFTERQQKLENQYAFKCQCSGCSELNFSDLVINAFSCSKPGCFGAVPDTRCLDSPSKCSSGYRLPVDEMKREEINKVACLLFKQQDGSVRVGPGYCLNCGSHRDLELSGIKSKEAYSCLQRLREQRDTYYLGGIPPSILPDAVRAIHLLRTTLHAYNKDLAQEEDSLAEAFCLVGDFQQAMYHCKESVQILERLYHPKHIVIGNELVKLASIQLSMDDHYISLDNVTRIDEIFVLYYGSHAVKIFPYLTTLRKEVGQFGEEVHTIHSGTSNEE